MPCKTTSASEQAFSSVSGERSGSLDLRRQFAAGHIEVDGGRAGGADSRDLVGCFKGQACGQARRLEGLWKNAPTREELLRIILHLELTMFLQQRRYLSVHE